MRKQTASLGVLILATLLSATEGASQVSSRISPPPGEVLPHPTNAPRQIRSVFVVTEKRHKVQSGETLWGIARRYRVDLEELAQLNSRDPENPVIRIGDELKLPAAAKSEALSAETPAPPAPVEHHVKAGETLYGIARTHGVTVEALQLANAITDPAALPAGQVLKIPGGRPAPAPRPEPAEPEENVIPADDSESLDPPSPAPSAPPIGHQEAPIPAPAASTDIASPPAPAALSVSAAPTPIGASTPVASQIGETATPDPAAAPSPGANLDLRPTSSSPTMVITHMVEPNDSLEKLARDFRTTVDQIRLENPGIRSNRDLRVGADLRLRVARTLPRRVQTETPASEPTLQP